MSHDCRYRMSYKSSFDWKTRESNSEQEARNIMRSKSPVTINTNLSISTAVSLHENLAVIDDRARTWQQVLQVRRGPKGAGRGRGFDIQRDFRSALSGDSSGHRASIALFDFRRGLSRSNASGIAPRFPLKLRISFLHGYLRLASAPEARSDVSSQFKCRMSLVMVALIRREFRGRSRTRKRERVVSAAYIMSDSQQRKIHDRIHWHRPL